MGVVVVCCGCGVFSQGVCGCSVFSQGVGVVCSVRVWVWSVWL